MDAREILSQLNEKGYKSITAEQLKEFMRGNFHFCFLTSLFCHLFLYRFKKVNKIRHNNKSQGTKLFR